MQLQNFLFSHALHFLHPLKMELLKKELCIVIIPIFATMTTFRYAILMYILKYNEFIFKDS